MRKILISVIVFIIPLIICYLIFKPKTRLVEFEYYGRGDTVCALLDGEILQKTIFGEKELDSVKIIFSFDSLKNPKLLNDTLKLFYSHLYPYSRTCFSKSNGTFQKGFLYCIGINIEITKVGYDTLILKNYNAVPDQFSRFKAYLIKGNKKIETIIN